MKAYRGNGGIVPLNLNLILDVDEGVCSASRLCRFTTGQIRGGGEPKYPWNRRLGGHQNQFGRLEEEKISYPYRESIHGLPSFF
jgi:hypothetical protein